MSQPSAKLCQRAASEAADCRWVRSTSYFFSFSCGCWFLILGTAADKTGHWLVCLSFFCRLFLNIKLQRIWLQSYLKYAEILCNCVIISIVWVTCVSTAAPPEAFVTLDLWQLSGQRSSWMNEVHQSSVFVFSARSSVLSPVCSALCDDCGQNLKQQPDRRPQDWMYDSGWWWWWWWCGSGGFIRPLVPCSSGGRAPVGLPDSF